MYLQVHRACIAQSMWLRLKVCLADGLVPWVKVVYDSVLSSLLVLKEEVQVSLEVYFYRWLLSQKEGFLWSYFPTVFIIMFDDA